MLSSPVSLAIALTFLVPSGAAPHPALVGGAPAGSGRVIAESEASSGASSGESRGSRWFPPLDPVVVTRAFAPPAQNWLAGHRGVDLLSHPGQTVRAAGAGRIVFAGPLAGRGVLVIDHGGLRTTYEPVTATVRVGQRVVAGQVIGSVATGTGHCGSADCLHLGLIRDTTYLDPRLILETPHARLVPW